MKLIIIIVLSSTLYELKELKVPNGLTCENMYDQIITYKKNTNYSPGVMEPWVHSYYKGQRVGGYICEA
jgi:hypothetical protein